MAQPEDWPDGVRNITIGQISMLGVDNENQLYWDGKPVQIRRRVTLSFWQALGTFLLVVFTVIGGIGAAAQGWASAHQWSCQIEWVTWACPQAASLVP